MLYTGDSFSKFVVKGYRSEDIKEKLIDVLRNSKTGLSGIEISEKLGINRITMTKYLNVFAAEGLVKQKKIGSVNLWFIEEGIDSLQFPADFFQVKNKYLEYVLSGERREAYNIIRNSLHSGANPTKIIIEVIVPTIKSVQNSYDKGKIGRSEKNFLDEMISNSIQLINLSGIDDDPTRNVIILSADFHEALMAQAAATAFYSSGWKTSSLGDMSSAIDVMFDIDLQKFLHKVWPKKQGIMIIVIFSSTEGGFKFFSEAVNTNKTKFGKSVNLVICSNLSKKIKIKADFVSEDLENILQWCETVHERSRI